RSKRDWSSDVCSSDLPAGSREPCARIQASDCWTRRRRVWTRMTLTRSLSEPITSPMPRAATKIEIHSSGRNTTISWATTAVATAMTAPARFRLKMSATSSTRAHSDSARGAQPKTAEVMRTRPSRPGAGYPEPGPGGGEADPAEGVHLPRMVEVQGDPLDHPPRRQGGEGVAELVDEGDVETEEAPDARRQR